MQAKDDTATPGKTEDLTQTNNESANMIQAEQEAREKTEREKKDTKNATYIGNSNSKKFHYPYCPSVTDMKQSNMVYFY